MGDGGRTGGRTVRLAGGQGFYGDAIEPLADVLAEAPDYVGLEALAELTLAILHKDRARDESLGYTRDLPLYLMQLLPTVLAGRTKVVTNAGGINPLAALRMVRAAAQRHGLTGFRIGVVLGDDVLGGGAVLPDGFPPREDLLFANAYLGARPIARALDEGADVVLTGRVADAALFLGPLLHEFGWAGDDWDRLAAGSVVGHLLECSGQSTGGNHGGDWWTVPEPWRFAFPLADVAEDGTATITKPAAAGGRVDFDTVRQQLLYEVGDPTAYLTPDVVVDMTSVQLEDLGGDRVAVRGTRGRPPTGRYKVVGAVPVGWAAEVSLAFAWPDAEAKARAAADIARKRVAVAGIDVDEWCVELFGVSALHGPAAARLRERNDPSEVVLRLAWRTRDQEASAQVARHVVPLALSAPPPGSTPAGRARPHPTQLLELAAGTVPRDGVDALVRVVVEEV